MAFINHKGRTIAYRLFGDSAKPLMILAHPLGMTQGVWDDMIPGLLDHFRVLTWDLPGHGASSNWPAASAAIAPEDLAQEALTLASLAGAERFHFVGTSIGGVIGQQLLSQHADRLLTVTLTNTGAVIGTPDGWNQRSASVAELGLATMARDIVPRWFGQAACSAEPALLDGWQLILGRNDGRSYGLLCEMLGRCDFTNRLAQHQVRVLLIGGSDDVATPPTTLKTLAEQCAVGAPVILDGIGHVPSIECPHHFSELLIEFCA